MNVREAIDFLKVGSEVRHVTRLGSRRHLTGLTRSSPRIRGITPDVQPVPTPSQSTKPCADQAVALTVARRCRPVSPCISRDAVIYEISTRIRGDIRPGGGRCAGAACARAPRLFDEVRRQSRLRHDSLRTRKVSRGWICRFILLHGKREPQAVSGRGRAVPVSSRRARSGAANRRNHGRGKCDAPARHSATFFASAVASNSGCASRPPRRASSGCANTASRMIATPT